MRQCPLVTVSIRSSPGMLAGSPAPMSWLGDDGKTPDPHTRLLQSDDRSVVEVRGEPIEVAEKERRLGLGSPRPFAAEQDQRRCATVTLGEEDTEVGVGGDQHAVLGPRDARGIAGAHVMARG